MRHYQINKKTNRSKAPIFTIFSLLLAVLLGVTARGKAVRSSDYKTYTHHSGLTFQYPANWTVTAIQGGINILPGDAKKNAMGQPLENLILFSAPLEGITSVNSPRLLQEFDSAMNQLFGNLRRQGKAMPAASQLGDAIFVHYGGTSNIGIEVTVGVYGVLHQNNGLYLLHAASKDLYAGRVSQARKIFSSIKMAAKPAARNMKPNAGPRDSALVGTWTRRESSYSSSYGGGGVGSETNLKIVFGRNGVVAYGTGTVVFGGNESVSINSGGGQDVYYGTWTSSNGVIHIKWQEGSTESFPYTVFEHDGGLALKLVLADGKKYFIKQ